jgi:hypothetical protein
MNYNRHIVLDPWESLRIVIMSAYWMTSTHRQSINSFSPFYIARNNAKIITPPRYPWSFYTFCRHM